MFFITIIVLLLVGLCIRQTVKTVEESPVARQAALGGLSLLLKALTKR
jgi:hypothetical protein